MIKVIRVLAPAVALAIVVAAGVAALGGGNASAQPATTSVRVAQPAPTVAPTSAPEAKVNDDGASNTPDAEAAEPAGTELNDDATVGGAEQTGSDSEQDGETQDGSDGETQDETATPAK